MRWKLLPFLLWTTYTGSFAQQSREPSGLAYSPNTPFQTEDSLPPPVFGKGFREREYAPRGYEGLENNLGKRREGSQEQDIKHFFPRFGDGNRPPPPQRDKQQDDDATSRAHNGPRPVGGSHFPFRGPSSFGHYPEGVLPEKRVDFRGPPEPMQNAPRFYGDREEQLRTRSDADSTEPRELDETDRRNERPSIQEESDHLNDNQERFSGGRERKPFREQGRNSIKRVRQPENERPQERMRSWTHSKERSSREYIPGRFSPLSGPYEEERRLGDPAKSVENSKTQFERDKGNKSIEEDFQNSKSGESRDKDKNREPEKLEEPATNRHRINSQENNERNEEREAQKKQGVPSPPMSKFPPFPKFPGFPGIPGLFPSFQPQFPIPQPGKENIGSDIPQPSGQKEHREDPEIRKNKYEDQSNSKESSENDSKQERDEKDTRIPRIPFVVPKRIPESKNKSKEVDQEKHNKEEIHVTSDSKAEYVTPTQPTVSPIAIPNPKKNVRPAYDTLPYPIPPRIQHRFPIPSTTIKAFTLITSSPKLPELTPSQQIELTTNSPMKKMLPEEPIRAKGEIP